MGKLLHNSFKLIVNELKNQLPALGESGSEVSYFITEHKNIAEVTILPTQVKKAQLKETFKDIKKTNQQ